MAIRSSLKFMQANKEETTTANLKIARSFRWLTGDEEETHFAEWEAMAVAMERDRLIQMKRQPLKDIEIDAEAYERDKKVSPPPVAPPIQPRTRPSTEASSSSSSSSKFSFFSNCDQLKIILN